MNKKPLEPRQELFCQHYIANGFNGTKAAIAAGYSEKTANEIAAENLAKPSIKGRIEELKGEMLKKMEITQEDVMKFIFTSVNLDPSEFMDITTDGKLLFLKPIKSLPIEVRRLIQGIEQTRNGIKVTFVSKERMLDMAARFLSMYKDKLEVTSSLTADERTARIAELRAKLEGDGPK